MSGRIYGTTQCLNCGKIFEKRTSRQKFCNLSCKIKFHNNKKKNYGETECAECGKTFTKSKPEQRYCSNSCKGTVVNKLIEKLEESEMEKQENKIENEQSAVLGKKTKKRNEFLTLEESIERQEEYIEKITEQHKKDLVNIKEKYKKDLSEARKTLFELRQKKRMRTEAERDKELLSAIAVKFGVDKEKINGEFIAKLSLNDSETDSEPFNECPLEDAEVVPDNSFDIDNGEK